LLLLPVLLYLALVLAWSILAMPSANTMLLRDDMSLLTLSCFVLNVQGFFLLRWNLFQGAAAAGCGKLKLHVANLSWISLFWTLSETLRTLVRLLMPMPLLMSMQRRMPLVWLVLLALLLFLLMALFLLLT
jgi:hypothetical protein